MFSGPKNEVKKENKDEIDNRQSRKLYISMDRLLNAECSLVKISSINILTSS